MIITNAAIDRSTTVFVLLLIIVAVGGYSYVVLPRESSPEVVVPFITVVVPYEGVAPEDMESLVTLPIERRLTGISGVKEIQSTTVEGLSTTVIEFDTNTVIEDALQRVRDKVDEAKPDLPMDAEEPIVNEINISEFPILVMSITGFLPLPVLTALAEELEDRFEAIQGVLAVEIVGGVEREIQIEVDPDRVAEYGIPLSDLVNVTRLENVNTPGGAMELGDAKYLMRTPGEFQTPEEIEGLIIKMGPNGMVYLRDVATVRDGFKEQLSRSRLNGRPSVTLTISKRAGENIIDIADEVNAILAEAEKRFPPGVDIALTWDESVWIRDMVYELENSILSGLVLVLIVIFLFLGFANAIFVALAIPVSMLITFGVLYMLDVTLNMVVLFSLILALGMLVDNGIVIIENIHRHVQWGEEQHDAAKRGAGEVAWPIFSSTMTTLAAFFPLYFWPGIMGDFMMYLPLTLTIALLGSLFVGLVVNPALASIFMRRRLPKNGVVRRERHPVLHVYTYLLKLALRWRAVTLTLAVTVMIVISVVFLSTARTEFMPSIEPPQAYINVEAAEGVNLDTSDEIVRHAEAVIEPFREHIDYVIANIGSRGAGPGGGMGSDSTHLSRITIDFPDIEDRTVPPSRIIEELRGLLTDIPGATFRFDELEMGPPTGPPVNVEISGEDFDVLGQLAQEVRDRIQHVPGLVDLRDDFSTGMPQVRISVDRQQAWRTGLSTQAVGFIIQAAISGVKAADFRAGEDEYDVMVRFPSVFREDLANIQSMMLINERGQAIPLSSVATVEQATGMGSIHRINRRRTVTVSADVTRERSSTEVLAEVQSILARDIDLPVGYTISYTGESEDMVETQSFLIRAFVIALLLITLVLVTQFNSISQPFIIMMSVVLSLGGVFLGLFLFRMPFGILMTGLGCISLAGVVVNNAIVLIDFINQLRRSGKPVTPAIIEAGMTRFRPVMLTAITTILGLIPMAIGISVNFRALMAGEFSRILSRGGESSQWWGSMAIAVIFGLSFATVLTLIVVPVLYSSLDDLARLFRGGSASVEKAVANTGDEVPVE